MTREELIYCLAGKSEQEISLAIMYAENYMKYGADITKKIETATENAYVVNRAERYGYIKAVEEFQKRVQPLYTTTSHPFHVGLLYYCGNCHEPLERDRDIYCRHCGISIDWESGAVEWKRAEEKNVTQDPV